VDADVLAYQSAAHHEVALEVEPGYWTWNCDINLVKDSINSKLSSYLELLDAEDYILCLTDDTNNFRKSIASTYKGRRSNIKRPLVLKPIRQWMINEFDAQIYPGLEGDDVMGILATNEHEGERVILSIDKDMKTIPGLFCKDVQTGIVEISEDEANYWHFYQTLIGDYIDGYSGCPSIGPVKAKEILDKDCTWETVVKTFEKKKLTEDDALVQARLARILRSSDFNVETGEPILWQPQ
jgi:DNA polymerase-1